MESGLERRGRGEGACLAEAICVTESALCLRVQFVEDRCREGYSGTAPLDLSCELKMAVQINITPNGRMSLPADLRKRLGLHGGGVVYLDETDDGVVLRTAAQAVARAQALAKRYTDGNAEASVDAFLSRRREDSGE